MIPHKQLSLADVFSDCKEKFENDKYQFLSLLENTINLDDLVPASFINSCYNSKFQGFSHNFSYSTIPRVFIFSNLKMKHPQI